MKYILSYLFLMGILTSGFSQQFETDLLPDSLSLHNGNHFTTDGENIHAIVRAGNPHNYYYLKIEDDNYEFIPNVPYEIGPNRTVGMEIYDNDVYHLTRTEGVRIYKQNGTWDSLTVNNGLKSGYVKGLFKDNDKLYIISRDTLNYYDGTDWNYFFVNTYGSVNTDGSSKITKHNNKIYFNSRYGIYVFDGTSLELLIDMSRPYSFEIFENKIYVAPQNLTYSYLNPLVFDLSGLEITTDIGRFLNPNGGRAVMCNVNDTLYCLDDNKGICIQNNEIIQIQYDLINMYGDPVKMLEYKNGVLAMGNNQDGKRTLIYTEISQYNSFGTTQLNTTYRNLDINQVDASYMNQGQMFWDGNNWHAHEVPKGSGQHSSFASGLWFSAKDQSDQVHVAVAMFNSIGQDFFPGPLRATGNDKGTTDTAYAQQFDYIWKISREEILLHQINYQDNDYNMPSDIQTWPAHGSVADGYTESLAPFIDTDDNGIYEPENGDYPDIKGDMSLYWIFNDNLSTHVESYGSIALGAEIHAQAYAYTCDTLTGQDSILNYTTFLNYRVINRSDTNYHNFSSAFWSDADIGDWNDDYVGTNIELNSIYLYNGDDMDGSGNRFTYGINPPAQFYTFLDAPLAEENDGLDNDNDGVIDETGEKSLLKSMQFFQANSSVDGYPVNGQELYNYMNHLWRNGRPLVYGGTGYNPDPTGGTPAKYMFPGESDPWMNGTFGVDPNYLATGGWSEENEGNDPGDRRGIATSGSFDFNAGDELEFTMAMVFSRGDNGAFSSVTKGFADVARITEMYNNGELHGCGLENVNVPEKGMHSELEIYPNPAKEQFVIKGADVNSKYQIIDIKGQLVKQGESIKAPISIKNLDSGTYIVRVISNQTVNSQKLVIE